MEIRTGAAVIVKYLNNLRKEIIFRQFHYYMAWERIQLIILEVDHFEK